MREGGKEIWDPLVNFRMRSFEKALRISLDIVCTW